MRSTSCVLPHALPPPPQGPLLLAEHALVHYWRRAGLAAPPHWLRGAITMPLLLFIGYHLFFTPLDAHRDIVPRLHNAMLGGYVGLVDVGTGLMQRWL